MRSVRKRSSKYILRYFGEKKSNFLSILLIYKLKKRLVTCDILHISILSLAHLYSNSRQYTIQNYVCFSINPLLQWRIGKNLIDFFFSTVQLFIKLALCVFQILPLPSLPPRAIPVRSIQWNFASPTALHVLVFARSAVSSCLMWAWSRVYPVGRVLEIRISDRASDQTNSNGIRVSRWQR